MSFIDFENVKKEYTAGDVTIHAVQNCSFSIEKGELVVILGPSGAGKTTILNLLGGMDSPSGGGIIVDNSNVHQYGKKELINYRRNDIGFVFQFYNLAISEEWSFALSAGKDKSSCSFCLSAHFGYCIVRECDHRYLNVDAGHR